MAKYLPIFMMLCMVLPLSKAEAQAPRPDSHELKSLITEMLRENPDLILDVVEKNALDILGIMEQAALKKEAFSRHEQRVAALRRPLQPMIDLNRPVRGNIEAPVTIIEYGDFYCRYCAASARVLQTVLNKYKDKVRFLYKHNTLNQAAVPIALTFESIAKHDLEKAWKFYDMVFDKQDLLKDGLTSLKEVQKVVNVDADLLQADLEAARVYIEQDKQEAQAFGFRGTPVFLVNGVAIHGAVSETEFFETIDIVLGSISPE